MARPSTPRLRPTDSATAGDEPVVPLRHPGRWIASAVVLVLLAMLAHALVTNAAFKWRVVGQYMFSSQILTGLARTGELTAVAIVIGIVLGTVLAVMRLSGSPLLVAISAAYSWFFRSVPVLVQLIFWYNFGALYDTVSLGVPFGPELLSWKTNSLIGPMTAAFLGLGLDQAAYTSEVVRAGILSVGRGQTRAAMALGMSKRLAFRRVIYPQAMRLIIPPLSNELIAMLKNTSLVSVIAVAELLYSAQLIYARTYQTIPLLIVASLWYLALVSVLSIGQHFLETRFAHD